MDMPLIYVNDACTNVTCLQDTFDVANEITKLVKKSPQRETHLKAVKVENENIDPGVDDWRFHTRFYHWQP